MRRRQSTSSGAHSAVPAWLLRYDPADWGTDEHAPCRYYVARLEWEEQHPPSPLDGHVGPHDLPTVCIGPDVPFNADNEYGDCPHHDPI